MFIMRNDGKEVRTGANGLSSTKIFTNSIFYNDKNKIHSIL